MTYSRLSGFLEILFLSRPIERNIIMVLGLGRPVKNHRITE